MLALIIVGFAMATLGVALLLLGEVPFIAGKRISAWRSRLIGAVLLGFAPLALGVRQLTNLLFDADTIEGPVLTWSLFGFCWFVVALILFRVMVPKGAPRKSTPVAKTSKKNPFGDVAPEEPEEIAQPAPEKKSPAAKKSRKSATDDKDPFDFG